MNPIPGQTNLRIWTLVDSDGDAVTDAGGVTVAYYLQATSGTNAGNWWTGSTWSGTEASCGSMTYGQRGQWSISVAQGAWADQIEYSEYAVDSGGVAIVVSRQFRCGNPTPDAIADGLLDRVNGIENNVTLRQAVRVMAAVLAGKVSGAGSGDEKFMGLDGLTLRVEVAADAAGNRTNVNYS